MTVEKLNLIWLQGQGCSGCTVSLTGSAYPSISDLLAGFIPQLTNIDLVFHPTLMVPHGERALEPVRAAIEGKLDPFVLLLEGSIPSEDVAKKSGGFWCAVGEHNGRILTINELVRDLSEKAAAAVAIGTCASYGGIPHGAPNPTGAKGLLTFLGREWRSKLGIPVVCIPGCPAQGDHVVETLAHLILTIKGLAPPIPLDKHHRPLFLFGKRVHESCPRAGYFASGKYSEAFGEPYCMGLLGCKGLITYCDVPERGFMDGLGGCPTVGSICIGCTEPEFPDAPFSPFLKKAPASAYAKETFHDIKGHIYALFHRLKRREI